MSKGNFFPPVFDRFSFIMVAKTRYEVAQYESEHNRGPHFLVLASMCKCVKDTGVQEREKSAARHLGQKQRGASPRALYKLPPAPPMTAWSLTKLMRDFLGQKNLGKIL